jgi:hypothetical protein
MTRYVYGRRLIDERNLYRRWIDPRVRTLRLADVLAYLRQRGWTQVPSDREGFLVFQEPPGTGPEGGVFYQFVPDSEKYDIYPRLMFDLLTGVAEAEDRQAVVVIDDILRLAASSQPNGPAQTRATDAEVTSK